MKKDLLMLIALLAITFMNGCKTVHRSLTREILMGTYVYKSDSRSRESESRFRSLIIGDRLILNNDGKYEIIIDKQSRPGSVITGHWIWTDGDPAIVYLDHGGYPIELDGKNIRLIIDNDINGRYEKLR